MMMMKPKAFQSFSPAWIDNRMSETRLTKHVSYWECICLCLGIWLSVRPSFIFCKHFYKLSLSLLQNLKKNSSTSICKAHDTKSNEIKRNNRWSVRPTHCQVRHSVSQSHNSPNLQLIHLMNITNNNPPTNHRSIDRSIKRSNELRFLLREFILNGKFYCVSMGLFLHH